MIGLLSVSTGIGGVSSEALLAAPPSMKLGRIMPLGDSITKGAPAGAYRDPLFSLLKKGGYSFSFVGSLDENPTAALTAEGQEHHQGHSSMGMDWIRDNLKPFFAANQPDRILLAIGANDIGGATVPDLKTRMENLVTAIFTLQPKGILHYCTSQNFPVFSGRFPGQSYIPVRLVYAGAQRIPQFYQG